MGEKKESSISFSYARKLISCKTHIQKPCVGNMKQRTHAVNKDCVHDVSYCWGPYKPMIVGVDWLNPSCFPLFTCHLQWLQINENILDLLRFVYL